jgi:hypothetical protein
MPYTYTVDSKKDVLFIRAEGKIDDQETISLACSIASNVKYHPGMRSFTDLTEVTRNGLSRESLAQIGKILRFSPRARRVIVAGNATNYGVSRMYQTYCDINGVPSPEIFRTREEALAYLNEGVPPDKVFQAGLNAGEPVEKIAT